MKEQRAIFIIDILKNIINVYFDTFFVFYFFKVANYEVLPLAKYYISLYLFIVIGFFAIRNAMKKNLKVPYFRIGISMQALYIAAIMLLKDDIINYIIPVGILKGLADGFYHFPKNILNSDKISNEARQKFSGMINIINKVMSIIIPIVLGVVLTFMSYTDLGKIFFLLFVVMFIVSFGIKDEYKGVKKFEVRKFINLVKKNKDVRASMMVPFLSGLTYSSGVMGTIVTLSKINNFKTNLNLGIVDSICAAVSLLICILFAMKIKRKSFRNLLLVSGIASFISLVFLGVYPSMVSLVVYLLVRYSFILLINLISDNVVVNLSNDKKLKSSLKAEYFFSRDVIFSISRCLGYLILIIVCATVGMEYINYILIVAGVSLLIEAILVGNLSTKQS